MTRARASLQSLKRSQGSLGFWTFAQSRACRKKDDGTKRQVVRILNVVRILERHPQGISTEAVHRELQREGFKASKRTVYRDLEAVEEAHFPLEREERDDGQHVWKFSPVTVVSGKVQISYDEIVALYIAKETLEPLRPTVFYKDISSFRRPRRTHSKRKRAEMTWKPERLDSFKTCCYQREELRGLAASAKQPGEKNWKAGERQIKIFRFIPEINLG